MSKRTIWDNNPETEPLYTEEEEEEMESKEDELRLEEKFNNN
jgi:hypothetical protein